MPEALIILEHDGARLRPGALGAVRVAGSLGASATFLVLGAHAASVAETARGYGAAQVFWSEHPAFKDGLAGPAAEIAAEIARSRACGWVLATSSTFVKDTLPRIAALLDAGMITEVCGLEFVDGQPRFQRVFGAGAHCATVAIDGPLAVLSVRNGAFPVPAAVTGLSPISEWIPTSEALESGPRLIARTRPTASRPDLGDARIVVSGGRGLKDKQTFERLIGGLADALGAAVGATRAAIDAGYAGAECQVGQTARTVAPELYIAVGISGAIQHTAGITDAKVIVAVNRDPDAPIFQLSTYGLVGDLNEIVPQLISAARI